MNEAGSLHKDDAVSAMRKLTMTRNTASRLFAVGLASAILGMPLSAWASDLSAQVETDGPSSAVRFIPLGVGKSFVVDLPRDAKDVLVADPKVANAVVRSARRAYLIGVTVGQTNVFFFDAQGRQIAGFDIAVTRDLNGVRSGMRQLLPSANIKVEGVGPDSVMLSGTVANPGESQQAFDLATKLVGDPTKVVNNLTIKGRDQVMLKVTVAEVQRDIIKQFGINLSGSLAYSNSVINFNNTNPFSINGGSINNSGVTGGWFNGGNSISATLQAMERAGVMRTLAEPNLTAISGESANFLVGGEFPVPGGYSCDPGTVGGSRTCQISIQYKKFGVGLNFTPIVLSEGRISLKVMTEVSELSSENSIVLQPTPNGSSVTVPSIRVRRAETTVEVPSGGALAMAGMIQEQTRQAVNGLPGAQQVPILGALFRSRDYINRQSELMVIVTPYIVRAVAPKELSRPDDNYADASDPGAIFLGKLNRIYGPPGKGDPRRQYHGSYGFILD
jgi:pilus assembly protein CpaC